MNHFSWQNSIEQYDIGEGNKLYGIRDQQLPVIYFQIVFNHSAIFDPEEESGRTYILTQMLLKGNNRFPKDQLYQKLDEIGGSLNIYATADYVTITGKVIRYHFSDLIEILKRLLNEQPDFSEEEFKIIKSRALDHLLTLRDNDHSLLNHIFLSQMFQDRSYGKVLSGTQKTLNKMSIHSLHQGFDALLNCGMTIAIAGDYSSNDLTLLKSFAKEKVVPQSVNPPVTSYQPKGLELYYYHKPQLTQTYTVMGQKGVRGSQKEIYEMILFNKYFGADFTSILPQEIRERNGWSYYVQSDLSIYRYAALFSMEYAPNTDVTVESFIYLKNLFKKSIEQVPKLTDIQFTIEKYINSLMFQFSTTLKQLGILVEHLIYGYPNNFYRDLEKKFRTLSPQMLSNTINKIIFPEDQVVVMVGNIEPLLPDFKSKDVFSKIESVNNRINAIL